MSIHKLIQRASRAGLVDQLGEMTGWIVTIYGLSSVGQPQGRATTEVIIAKRGGPIRPVGEGREAIGRIIGISDGLSIGIDELGAVTCGIVSGLHRKSP